MTVGMCLALIAQTSPLWAVDRVTHPYAGVMHLHREAPGIDLHVVTVDLKAGNVDVVSTAPGTRRSRVSTFAYENNAQIAINANFFDSTTCGLTMGRGRLWRDAYTDHRCRASIAFGMTRQGLRAEVFDSTQWLRTSPYPWATEIVTGEPWLIRGGVAALDDDGLRFQYRFHPRTVVGLTQDKSTLVILAVDGRRSGIPGATALELIPLLEEFAVSDGFNLDGGGSTTLWIEAEGGVVNRPSDRFERSVGNHLGIRITRDR